MEKAVIQSEEFYRQLALLFYAFAAADRKIVIEEKQSIITAVNLNWGAQAEAKEIIYSTLRKAIEEKMEADAAFVSFDGYYKENIERFTPDLKLRILEDTDNITRSFSGRNKSELIMLTRLHFLFKDKQ